MVVIEPPPVKSPAQTLEDTLSKIVEIANQQLQIISATVILQSASVTVDDASVTASMKTNDDLLRQLVASLP